MWVLLFHCAFLVKCTELYEEENSLDCFHHPNLRSSTVDSDFQNCQYENHCFEQNNIPVENSSINQLYNIDLYSHEETPDNGTLSSSDAFRDHRLVLFEEPNAIYQGFKEMIGNAEVRQEQIGTIQPQNTTLHANRHFDTSGLEEAVKETLECTYVWHNSINPCVRETESTESYNFSSCFIQSLENEGTNYFNIYKDHINSEIKESSISEEEEGKEVTAIAMVVAEWDETMTDLKETIEEMQQDTFLYYNMDDHSIMLREPTVDTPTVVKFVEECILHNSGGSNIPDFIRKDENESKEYMHNVVLQEENVNSIKKELLKKEQRNWTVQDHVEINNELVEMDSFDPAKEQASYADTSVIETPKTQKPDKDMKSIDRALEFFPMTKSDNNLSKNEESYEYKYSKVAHVLYYVNETIRCINTERIHFIKSDIECMMLKHMRELKEFESSLSISKRLSHYKYISKVSEELKELNKFINPKCILHDTTNILDTENSLQLYIQLILNFNPICVTRTKHTFKKSLFDLENKFRGFYDNTFVLPKSVKELKSTFSTLILILPDKSSLYKLQYFYKKTLHVNNELNRHFHFSPVELLEYISDLIMRLKLYKDALEHTDRIDIDSVIDICNNHVMSNAIQGLTNRLEIIENNQKELKINIKNYIKDSRHLGFYLYYHLSFLLLHRLVPMRKVDSELHNCFKVYRTFIEHLHATFFRVNPLYIVKNPCDFDILFTSIKEETVDLILIYLYLNIIKYIFQDIIEKLKKCYAEVKACEEASSEVEKLSKLVEVKKYFDKAFDSLDTLNEGLKVIQKYKCGVQQIIELFNKGNEINKEINNALCTLNNVEIEEETGNIEDKEYTNLLSIFNEIRHLYKELEKAVFRNTLHI